MDESPKYLKKGDDFMADNANNNLLTPDQVWELRNKELAIEQAKVDASIEIKKIEVESAEKIATEANKVAAEANKVGFWGNVVNAAKVVGYVLLGIVYLVVSLISKKDDQAFELDDTYRAKQSGTWTGKIFDRAKAFIDGLKN